MEVNEKGSEAAAATAVVMMCQSSLPVGAPTAFYVDHPFLFFVIDNRADAVLFSGHLTIPPAKSEI